VFIEQLNKFSFEADYQLALELEEMLVSLPIKKNIRDQEIRYDNFLHDLRIQYEISGLRLKGLIRLIKLIE
jgi:hypothetical protein